MFYGFHGVRYILLEEAPVQELQLVRVAILLDQIERELHVLRRRERAARQRESSGRKRMGERSLP